MSIKRYDWDSQEEADGNFVLYTDHAAEVSALRAMAEDVMLMSDDLGLDTETPEAIISATSDKVRLAVRALLEERATLRAQLEAAKENWHQAEQDVARLQKHLERYQLTAQPEGVRPRPWTADGYIVRDANGDGFAECPTKADAKLLTTPAAKETKP